MFDPTYDDSLYSRQIEGTLCIKYLEHPQTDKIRLVGEVYFPNVAFESDEIRFGYILNQTEITRPVLMTNTSPLPVRYRWKFLVGDRVNIVFRRQTELPASPTVIASERDARCTTEIDEMELLPEVINRQHFTDTPDELTTNGETSDPPAVECAIPPTKADLKEAELSQPGELTKSDPVEDTECRVSYSDAQSMPPKDEEPFDQGTRSDPLKNDALDNLLEQENDVIPLGIEEIFDINPLFGELAPGASQLVNVVFYGHTDIEATVTAVCEVDGGPAYSMAISGAASIVDYYLDRTELELAVGRYDRTAVGEIALANTGLVGFEFHVTPDNSLDESEVSYNNNETEYPLPGLLTTEPSMGYLGADEVCTIRISYLARKPERFERRIQVQVAQFAPKTVLIRGQADFPRLSLDLPRRRHAQQAEGNDENLTSTGANTVPMEVSVYENTMSSLLQELRAKIVQVLQQTETEQGSFSYCCCHVVRKHSVHNGCNGALRSDLDPIFAHEGNCTVSKALHSVLTKLSVSTCDVQEATSAIIPDITLQMEAERVHVCEVLKRRAMRHLETAELHSISQCHTNTHVHDDGAGGQEVKNRSILGNKIHLPSYVMDFGVVIFGSVVRQCVRAANLGHEPISCRFEPSTVLAASKLGVTPSISAVRQMPVTSESEWIEWEIVFDPKGANLSPGPVETELLINVANGPIVPILVRAEVVVPKLLANVECLEFADVQRGEALLMPIRLENPCPIRVHWMQEQKWPIPLTNPTERSDRGKFGWQSKRRRAASQMPRIFEVIPSEGSLKEGEKVIIQVKFTPLEQRRYEEWITVFLENSSETVRIKCCGHGLDPQLQFDQTLIQFDPCLPFVNSEERNIVVKNRCDFPIEFYAVELDLQSYQEDKMLRILDGYDEFGLMLLPPRKPGEGLPPEIVAHYEEAVKSGRCTSSEDSRSAQRESSQNSPCN